MANIVFKSCNSWKKKNCYWNCPDLETVYQNLRVHTYKNILHKTEVQTVILRCWTGLKLNWFKSYGTNVKKTHKRKKRRNCKNITQMRSSLQNHKIPDTEIFAFCIITFEPIKVQTRSAPQNDGQNSSFVKDFI